MFPSLFAEKTSPLEIKKTKQAIQAEHDTLNRLYQSLQTYNKQLGHPKSMEHLMTLTQCILASAKTLSGTFDDKQSPMCQQQLKKIIPYLQSVNRLLDDQKQFKLFYADCINALGKQHFHPILTYLREQQKVFNTVQEKALLDADDKLLIWIHRVTLDTRLTGHDKAANAVDWQVQTLEESLVVYWQAIGRTIDKPSRHKQQLMIDVKAVLGQPQWFPAHLSPTKDTWIKEGYRQREVVHQHRGGLWSWVQSIEQGMNELLALVANLPVMGDWLSNPSVKMTPDTWSAQLADDIETTAEQLIKRTTP